MDFKVIHIDETSSTNGWLREFATDALDPWSLATEGTQEHGCTRRNDRDANRKEFRKIPCHSEANIAVVAEYQTAGRGCGSNTWESERGKNLTFSVLLHPTEIPADCQFRISEAVSVALCETLEQFFRPVTIKWPNDIYVGDRKICGILIENQLRGRLISDSIVGIGLNVNQTEFRSDAPNPVSLAQLTGHEEDREALLQAFLQRLSDTMAMAPEVLIEAYRSRLYRREGIYPFSDKEGTFEAKVLNVLDDGRLVLLDTEGKARMYAFKEVVFIIKN